MGFKVDISDMLEALRRMDHPRFEAHKRAALALADLMAEDMASAMGIEIEAAEFDEPAFGGLLVGVVPASAGQVLPEALEGLDDEAAWTESGGLVSRSEAEETKPGRAFVFAEGKKYEVWSHRPMGFEIVRKRDGASAFLQGESALTLDEELEAAQRANEQGTLKEEPADAVCGEYDHILTVESGR